jgi:hypothetical protein
VSLALSLRAPFVLLTWGPLLLGVPHLVSDVRYMVARQGLMRRPLWCAAVVPCLVGCMVQPARGWGAAAIAMSVLLARGSVLRRLSAAVGCALVWYGARSLGPRSDVLFAHAHNLVALACWAAWARGSRLQLLPALAVSGVGCWLILSGGADGLLLRAAVLSGGRFLVDAGSVVATLSPVDHPLWALRWAVCFAFLQSVHYGVWLRSLPDEDRARQGLRSFQSSYRALAADLAPWVLLVSAALACALCITAIAAEAAVARNAYLRLAFFHGPLELAVIVLLWIEARPPQRAG